MSLFPDPANQAESSDLTLSDQQNVKGKGGVCVCLCMCVYMCVWLCGCVYTSLMAQLIDNKVRQILGTDIRTEIAK